MSKESRKPSTTLPDDDNGPEPDPDFDAECERVGLDPVLACAFLRPVDHLIEREKRLRARPAARPARSRKPEKP